MIDENEIMPFNFVKYGGVYTGGHNGMRYMIRRTGDKPDFVIEAIVWQGPYAYPAMTKEQLTSEQFDYSPDGRLKAIEWLKEQYETRIDEWNQAPSVLDVKPIIHE